VGIGVFVVHAPLSAQASSLRGMVATAIMSKPTARLFLRRLFFMCRSSLLGETRRFLTPWQLTLVEAATLERTNTDKYRLM
jgi:hypothetical protein